MFTKQSDVSADVSSNASCLWFRARLLGPFELECDGQSVDLSRWQPRVTVLFKLLITAKDRQRLRDDLIDVLWPDALPDVGAGNLRMLTHRLRLSIGGAAPAVVSSHGWISLNTTYTWDLDLDELESAASGPADDFAVLSQAAGLYRGEPLMEDRYEDWAAPVRERGRRAFRVLCLRLASWYEMRREYGEAGQWLERQLSEDPLDEDAFRRLMIVLALAGNRAEALRRFAQFAQRFREELDAPVSADTAVQAETIALQTARVDAETGRTAVPAGKTAGTRPEGLLDRVTLQRLSVEETGALVASMLGGTRGISDFVENVDQRTKDNPSFVERLFRALDGRHRLIRQGDAGDVDRVFEAENAEEAETGRCPHGCTIHGYRRTGKYSFSGRSPRPLIRASRRLR